MRRTVRFGERQLLVEFTTDGDRVEALITEPDRPPRTVSLLYCEVEAGVYSVLSDGRSSEVRVTRSHAAWVVESGGAMLHTEVEDPREAPARRRHGGGDGRQTLAAPMPGRVVRVLVEEGASVEQGQGLVVVEAMKMQNEMKAPRAGKVIALAARAGASVSAGEVLITLE